MSRLHAQARLEREARQPQASCALGERGELVPQRDVAAVEVRRLGQVLDGRFDVPFLLFYPREVLEHREWQRWQGVAGGGQEAK